MIDIKLWQINFIKEFERRTGIHGEQLKEAAEAEMEMFLEEDMEWEHFSPEDAVSECLYSWGD